MRETRTVNANENIGFMNSFNLIHESWSRMRELGISHIIFARRLECCHERIFVYRTTVFCSPREEGHSQSVFIWLIFPHHTQSVCDELRESLEECRVSASMDHRRVVKQPERHSWQ